MTDDELDAASNPYPGPIGLHEEKELSMAAALMVVVLSSLGLRAVFLWAVIAVARWSGL